MSFNVELEFKNNNTDDVVLVIPGFSNDAYLSTVEHLKTLRG